MQRKMKRWSLLLGLLLLVNIVGAFPQMALAVDYSKGNAEVNIHFEGEMASDKGKKINSDSLELVGADGTVYKPTSLEEGARFQFLKIPAQNYTVKYNYNNGEFSNLGGSTGDMGDYVADGSTITVKGGLAFSQFYINVQANTSPNKPNKPDKPTKPNLDNDRVNGIDRIETAIEISKKFNKKADLVIIVRHDLFPDSLTAGVLAKALDAPILLNSPERLDERVKGEIQRLGAKEILIIGGLNSIQKPVEVALNQFDKDIERIGGPNRYDTSALVAKRVVKVVGQKGKAVVASGEIFPDALAIGPFAAKEGYPIMLARQNSVDESVQDAFKALKVKEVYLIGGKNTLALELETKLPKLIERIGGADRYETAVLIAKEKFSKANKAFIASGEVFADALVIGPVAAKANAPILLVRAASAPETVVNYIQGSGIKMLTIVGGPNTVSEAVVQELIKQK